MSGNVGSSRVLTAPEITQLFIDTAQKVDRCFGFEIAKWLERYQELRKQPNFPEAALLIINAARIYGRKIEYVEELIYSIVRESESQNLKNNKRNSEEAEPGKKKRLKRLRPETLCEKFHCAEYIVKEFKSLPTASLCEKIVQKTRRQGGMCFEEEFATWTVRKDAKGVKKPPRRRLEMEEEEMCSHYTCFGESQIFDYDGEDIVGRRKDFKVFCGHIDAENQAVGNDIDLRKHYKRGETIERTCEEATELEDCSTVAMVKPTTEEVPEIVRESLLLEMPQSPNILPSDDEGIGMSQTFSNTIQLSDLSPRDWNMLSPNVELMDIMEHVKELPTTEFTINTSLKNLLGIDSAYLMHPEPFTLPTNLFERRSIVEFNILKLPEKKLKSRCLFALPKEWIAERREAERPPPPIPPVRRVFKLDMSLQNIPTPPDTPEPNDPEEFRGFDDSEILDITISNSQILSSTINPDKNSSISPHKHPRMSSDSGIQSPTHLMESMDTILEETASQLLANASDSGYASMLNSTQESIENSLLLNDCPEPSQTTELSDHQMNLQRIASEEHRQRVEDMKRMTDKVNRWHEYLKPILRLSQSRGHFDIHAYGTEILDAVDPEKNPPQQEDTTLGKIMEMKNDPSLLPRYFLSMLQLINTNNISIVAKRDVSTVTNLHDIHIKFLSAERHHEELSEGLSLPNGDKRKRSPSNGERARDGQKKKQRKEIAS